MRVVVTGAGNPTGEAIVRALQKEGHMIRLFGIDAETAARFEGVQWHPGHLTTIGSIEPVLAEREVLVHAACLDAPGKDKRQHAVHIERGTLGCKYGAERELLDQFIHVTPATPDKTYSVAQANAVATAESSRKVPVHIVRASSPEQAAQEVLEVIEEGQHFGRYPGRETDAVAS